MFVTLQRENYAVIFISGDIFLIIIIKKIQDKLRVSISTAGGGDSLLPQWRWFKGECGF